jgi:hypothetical protein
MASPIGMISAGFIADGFNLIPAIASSTGGIGLLYILCSILGLMICIGSWIFSDWRNIEKNEEDFGLEEKIMNEEPDEPSA